MTGLPEDYGNVFDPIETLTYVAAHTSTISLGTSVMNALFHTPVVLARRLSTLDHFSGGRVIVGLGQGWSAEEFETANVSMRRRGNGFAEYIDALWAAWGPDPVSFEGRFYKIPTSQIGPKPVQPGGFQVLVGVSDESSASVERAGRTGVGLHPIISDWTCFESPARGLPCGGSRRRRTGSRLSSGSTAPSPRPASTMPSARRCS